MTSVLIATSDRRQGGIQKALQDQLSLLAEIADISLSVLSPSSDFAMMARAHDVPVFTLSDGRRFAYRHMPALAHYGLSITRHDIALCHNGFMAKGLKRLAHQVIGICHNDKPHQFKGCDKLVCLTQKGMEAAAQAGWPESTLSLIPHYYEAPKPNAPDKPSLPLIVGTAGRMVAKKNLSYFIEIASYVRSQRDDILFEMGGAGALEEALSAQNRAAGSPVTLLGWTDFERFLDKLDIMIIPSLDEPFGYVYPEAMAQGVAVLSTPNFGGDYNLKGGAIAPLLPFDDVTAFGNEICRLADDLTALYHMQQRCFAHATSPAYHKITAKALWQALLIG